MNLSPFGRFFAWTALLAMAAFPAHAVTNVWGGGGGDGNWTTTANWTNNATPGSADTVMFIVTNYPSTFATTLNGDRTISSLVLATSNGVTISGSTLTLGSGLLNRTTVSRSNQTINSAIVLGADGLFIVNGGASYNTNLVVNGSIGESGGSRSLTVAGPRLVHLMGSNTFTGGLLITNAAGVVIGGTNAASSVTVGANGAAGTLLVGADYALGNGTVTLNPNATISGYGASRMVGNAVAVNGDFTVGPGASTTALGLTFTNLVTLNANVTVSNALGNDVETAFFAGGIGDGGAGRSLTLTAIGAKRRLMLTNSTYTGATVINNGNVLISGTNATSSVAVNPGATLTFLTDNPFSAGTMITASNATLTSSNSHSFSSPVTFTGTTNTHSGTGNLIFNGNVTMATSMVFMASGANAGNGFVFASAVGEALPGSSLTLGGNRTLSLLVSNSYSGGTYLVPGNTLVIGNNNSLGTGTLFANAKSGTITLGWTNSPVIANAIQMQGTNYLTGANTPTHITFTGPVTMTSNVVIRVDGNNYSATDDNQAAVFGGGFNDNGSNFSLTFASGFNNRYYYISNSSSYSGGTFIMNGLLKLASDNALPTAGALAVNSLSGLNDGFSLNGFNQTVGSLNGTGVVQLASSGTLTVGNATDSTFSGFMNGTGFLVKQGAGTLTLGGSNAYTGGTILSNGLLRLGAARAMTNGAPLTLSGGSLDTAGFSASVGTLSGSGGSLTNSAGLTVNQTSDGTFSGILTGSGSLTKQGGGVLALGGANNYSGGTFLSNGTLGISIDANLGDASGDVTFGGGALRITGTALSNLNARTVNWANFNLDIADASHTFTVTNSLANAKLVKGGAGTLVLNSASITNLGFSAGGGTLQVLSGASTFAGALAISNGSTLMLSGTNGQPAGTQPNFGLGGVFTVGNTDSGNKLIVKNGASVTGATLNVGGSASSQGNLVLVSGSGSSLATTNGGSGAVGINIGYGGGSLNSLIVSNAAQVTSAQAIQVGVGSSSNLLLVSGSGTLISNANNVNVGASGYSYGNAILVNDGAIFIGASVRVSQNAAASNSSLVVSGPDTFFQALSLSIGTNADISTSGAGAHVLVENGATLQVPTLSGGLDASSTFTNRSGILQFTSSSPTITPKNVSFVMTNGVISYLGVAAADITSKRITTNFVMQGDSGFRLVGSTNTALANYTFDSTAVSTNFQRLILMGAAPRWQSGRLDVGTGGELIVTNAVNATVGATFTNLGSVRVINSTVTWQSNAVLNGGNFIARSGTNTFSAGLFINGGALTLDSASLVLGAVSNRAGTISLLNSADVDVKGNWKNALAPGLTNMVWLGTNAFRLDNSSTTNAGQDYIFNTGRGLTNYTRLEMVNGTTLWQGGSLTIGANGTMLASNTSATVDAAFTNQGLVSAFYSLVTYRSNVVLDGGTFLTQGATNQFNGGMSLGASGVLTFTGGNSRVDGAISNSGTINTVNANVTYGGPVVISGLYSSDPSTNVFTSNLTVTASGALQGSNGDLFVFGGNFLNQSTNRSAFNLWRSAVLFTNLAAGTTNHTYDVSGSASVDIGTGFTNLDLVSTNFAIGTLSIAAGNRLTLTGSVSAVDGRTNALYVGWLDIQGLTLNNTNSQTHAFETLVAALSLPNINLYYSREDPRNQWLNEFLPNTGYDLWGGGLLLPIPEPSALLALAGGGALLVFLRRRKG